MDFDDFAEEAETLFGLNQHESADLLESLEEEGFDLEEDSLSEWGEEASDLIDFSEYEEDWMDYELDPDFPDDGWIEEGEEWEITADYEE
jgi:hypothetical protein